MGLSLYPYQEQAVDALVDKKKMLVAYDMGTGKTPITITAMERLMEEGAIQHTVLVVVLSSLKFQWQKEIAAWAPDSRSVVIDGTPARRKKIFEEVANDPPDYLITTYDLLPREFNWFIDQPWGAVVCDEATAIKGFRSKRSKAVKALSKRCNVRVALTGTPLSNGKPEEIFSIMEMVAPQVLGGYHAFDRTYIVRNPQGWVSRYKNLPLLHRTLEPAVIVKRQRDPDVARYLPEVRDLDPFLVPWDKHGGEVQRLVARDLLRVLDEAAENFGSNWTFDVASHYGHGTQTYNHEESQMAAEILGRVTVLRMLTAHPEVVRISAEKFNARVDPETGDGIAYAAWLQQQGLLDYTAAPKLERVTEYLRDFLDIDDDHKAVVFSTHRDMIPILAESLKKYGPRQFHGGMTARAKEANKERFQQDPASRLLISSDAGGFGVDLPQANMLISYDLPWTSGAALQRNSRIVRASSQWPSVQIARFLMADSIEERQWDALRYKSAVEAAVIDGGKTDDKGDVLQSVSSLRQALENTLSKKVSSVSCAEQTGADTFSSAN